MKHLYLFFTLLFVSTNLFAQSVPSVSHIKRQQQYDVKFCFLDLDIEEVSASISGNVLTRVKALVNNFDTFSVQLDSKLTIDSCKASLSGGPFSPATATRTGSAVNVKLLFSASVNNMVEVRIYYHGNPSISSGFFPTGGFFDGTNHKFSATPPYNAYNWWPCKQDLTDKADSSWFFITTDKASKGISNGVLTDTVTVAGNKKRWEWKSRYPVDFYLISFVVGKFTETTDYWKPTGRTDSMVLKFYNYTNSDKKIQKILQLYTDLFGLYPFYNEKLGIATVDLGGGIENQTIIGLGSFGAVEAHEIMHQWFGDNVTCASWRDIMLNEGFARWAESLYPEMTSVNPNGTRIGICANFETNTLNNPAGCEHEMADTTSINGVFLHSDLYYDKGAMIVNSLRFEVNNDSLFFLGLRNYQTQFGGKAATTMDLKTVMETTTGEDFTDFFNSWYYGYGFPTFNVKWNQDNNRLILQVNEITSSNNTPLFKTSLEIKAKRTQGDTIVRMYVDANTTNFIFDCPGTVTGLAIDPNQWIANGAGTILEDATLSGIETVTGQDAYFIYPNPAQGYIIVNSPGNNGKPVEVEFYNLVGQLIGTSSVIMGNQVPLPSNPEGVIIVKVNRSNFFKLVVQH